MTGATASLDFGVPVADGLFEMAGSEPRLIGSRCTGCQSVYFPQATNCRNPQCHAKHVARCLLPARGTLYSFTIQRYRPPPLFRVDDWSPYAIGLVDLGEGLQVMGMLGGIALEEVRIGMPLRLVVEPLYVDEERGSVVTYKFAPDAATEDAS